MKRKMLLLLTVFVTSVIPFVSCSKSNPASSPAPAATPTPDYISFQEGVLSYTGASDSEILANSSSVNGGSKEYMRIGYTTSLGVMRSLIRFDISSIPSGSIITKAKLTVRLNNSGGATTFSLRLVPAGALWLEEAVTWNQASNGAAWTGGDLSSANAAMPAVVSAGVTDVIVFEIENNVVQQWLDTPASNKGLAFITEDETAQNFAVIYTGERTPSSDRPLLEIEYR
ncbi:MAG TPA: DNRLRE domain-containing protein [Candidatus Goldiibacteriota bacterium]|nr:DNRLRE domain-containing protein [Candidatus Goldiibacteriota bacterium]HPN65454.1 DNRLRE domain-containing protein [Candidatus Goldiibacteriota bacterium]HRQ44881.1 DNRLRE domain-containing protein [Candidatus Goldiibacteriota bacterium]